MRSNRFSIPIPQYPLYTATLANVEAHPLPYYLDEANGWSFDAKSVEAAIDEARKKDTPVKAVSSF